MGGSAGTTGITLYFSPTAITVPAGETTFLLRNLTEAPHNMVIGSDRPTCSGSDCTFGSSIATSDTVGRLSGPEPFTVTDLAPGTYAFWCSISDHAALGMVGTLIVKP